MIDGGRQKRASFLDKILDLNKIRDSNTVMSIQSAKTGYPEELVDSVFNLQNVSLEQLQWIGETQSIEYQLKRELKNKHRWELLEHLLRQMEEKCVLKKQFELASSQGTFEDGNCTSMSETSSLQSALNSFMLSEFDENYNNQDVRAPNVPDIPLSPELSPLAVEVPSLWDNDEGRNPIASLNEESFASDMLSLPHENCADDKLTARYHGMSQQDMYPRNLVGCNSLKLSKLLHPQNELRMMQFSSSDGSRRCQNFDTHLFKTELCSTWTDFGYCPYGKCCQFAHGQEDLRFRPAQHKKFKTVRCKKYLKGYCPYGKRCCFIHDISERRTQASCGQSNQSLGRYQTSNWMGNYRNTHGNFRCMDVSPCWGRQAMSYHLRQ